MADDISWQEGWAGVHEALAARSVKRVLIQERNSIMRSMNTDVRYDIDKLPDFFKPLRYIFEDNAFTKMNIQISDVLYIIIPTYIEAEQIAEA